MQDHLTPTSAAQAQAVETRSQFIWKCYAHVVGAILALVTKAPGVEKEEKPFVAQPTPAPATVTEKN